LADLTAAIPHVRHLVTSMTPTLPTIHAERCAPPF
jgi:hypothetical protein